MILGIDGGNEETKICGPYGVQKFCSDIGEYRDRNLKNSFGEDDMVWEYHGKKGFAGTIAKYESEFGGSIRGDSKAHTDAKMRILLAIHRYSDDSEIFLVVGQPISTHSDGEKKKIKEMLIGKHEITVNGVKKAFNIRQVEVAPEGAASLLSNPQSGLIRIIDIGSGTVNFATLNNIRYVDRDSFTERFGMATIRTRDLEAIARKIASCALDKWDREDDVRLVGGGAKPLYPFLKQHFSNCRLFQPMLRVSMGVELIEPVYANAVAFYEIARKLYG